MAATRTDWADDVEGPDLAASIPPPQVTRNKDGTETVVTIFINEDGKRVKRTQRIKRTVIKKKENPRVAERLPDGLDHGSGTPSRWYARGTRRLSPHVIS